MNVWETPGKGLDIDNDGTIDLALGDDPFNAVPYRKDLFVEVDWMDCGASCILAAHSHKPQQSAIDDLVQAFANAPVDPYPDPSDVTKTKNLGAQPRFSRQLRVCKLCSGNQRSNSRRYSRASSKDTTELQEPQCEISFKPDVRGCQRVAGVVAHRPATREVGSDTAAEQLASLHSGGDHGLPPGVADASSKPSCGSHQAGDEPGAEAPAAPVAEVGPEAGPSGGSSQGAPDTLTDGVRGDILAAVDRANAAWTAASQSLDPSALNGNVAGQELRNDLAELDKLRSQGQKRKNLNTVFTVTDVTLDAAGHAIVRTHETWYAEISNAASGRLVQRTPATAYDETYTVEYLSGKWIVTNNEL
jgi:hypothetical protein